MTRLAALVPFALAVAVLLVVAVATWRRECAERRQHRPPAEAKQGSPGQGRRSAASSGVRPGERPTPGTSITPEKGSPARQREMRPDGAGDRPPIDACWVCGRTRPAVGTMSVQERVLSEALDEVLYVPGAGRYEPDLLAAACLSQPKFRAWLDQARADGERAGAARVTAAVEAVLREIEQSDAIPIGWEAATRSTVSIKNVRAALSSAAPDAEDGVR